MICLKTKQEIQIMRHAGKILAYVIQTISSRVKAGVKLSEIDTWVYDLIISLKARPAFKNYRGYPSNICASVDEVVVHGIPSGKALKDGEILGLDIGMELNGFFVDSAVTLPVGIVSDTLMHLVNTTKEALNLGIEQARAGNHLFDISSVIQRHAEKNGFSVVRDFVGHGIGKSLHEDPEIPNFGKAGTGPLLKEGMALAIEPMINQGAPDIEILDDGWTAVTKDRLASAHFEHTIVITANGPEILT